MLKYDVKMHVKRYVKIPQLIDVEFVIVLYNQYIFYI